MMLLLLLYWKKNSLFVLWFSVHFSDSYFDVKFFIPFFPSYNSRFIQKQPLRVMNFLCANDLNKHLISSVFLLLWTFLHSFIHISVRNLRVKEMNIKVAKLCNHFAIFVWVVLELRVENQFISSKSEWEKKENLFIKQ